MAGYNVMVNKAIAEIYQRVEENPTQKIPRIYQQVRAKFTENLDLALEDFDEDEEMPELSENEDIEILVPTLGKIIIPARFSEQINEATVSQEPEMIDSTQEIGPYRHI